MNPGNLPLNGLLALTPTPGGEDPEGFIDFERLARIAQRRMRVVGVFGLIGWPPASPICSSLRRPTPLPSAFCSMRT